MEPTGYAEPVTIDEDKKAIDSPNLLDSTQPLEGQLLPLRTCFLVLSLRRLIQIFHHIVTTISRLQVQNIPCPQTSGNFSLRFLHPH